MDGSNSHRRSRRVRATEVRLYFLRQHCQLKFHSMKKSFITLGPGEGFWPTWGQVRDSGPLGPLFFLSTQSKHTFCMLGNFHVFFVVFDFFKINFKKRRKILSGCRLGPTFHPVRSGTRSNLFAKIISRGYLQVTR